MNDVVVLYRGYYQDRLLAVDEDIRVLKYYLKYTRGLSKDEYDIQESIIDSDDIDKLYPNLSLVFLDKDLYVTQGDFEILYNEIQNEFQHYIDILDGMREYYDKIESIPLLEKHTKQFKETIHNMETELTTRKILNKLQKQIIKKSNVMSKNIEDYLYVNKVSEGNKELDRQYRYHLLYD